MSAPGADRWRRVQELFEAALEAGAEDVIVIRLVPVSASPGSVKPATLFLSCDANSDNFEIAAAVAVVALPVDEEPETTGGESTSPTRGTWICC